MHITINYILKGQINYKFVKLKIDLRHGLRNYDKITIKKNTIYVGFSRKILVKK